MRWYLLPVMVGITSGTALAQLPYQTGFEASDSPSFMLDALGGQNGWAVRGGGLVASQVSVVDTAGIALNGSQFVEENTAAWNALGTNRYAGVVLPHSGTGVEARVAAWIGPPSAVRVSWAGLFMYDQSGMQIGAIRVKSDGQIECINSTGNTATIPPNGGNVSQWVYLRIQADFVTHELHFYADTIAGDTLLDPFLGAFLRTHSSNNFNKAEIYAGRGTQGTGGSIVRFDDYAVLDFGAVQCPPCGADYDNNGGVDGGDLAAFFTDFEAGAACADVDANGGVDGGDLGQFFALFEAGGC